MKRRTKGAVTCAIAAALVVATALPAAAWYYTQLGYPGYNKKISTTLSESPCKATGASRGFNGASGTISTYINTGTGCEVYVNWGEWNGSYVVWGIPDKDPTYAILVLGSSWYLSRHGVDSV